MRCAVRHIGASDSVRVSGSGESARPIRPQTACAAVFNQASMCMFTHAITANRKCFGPLRQVRECTL